MKKIFLAICFALLISGSQNILGQKETQKKDDSKIFKAGILNGLAISLPKPVYPAAAMAVNAIGTVSIRITIGIDGSVESAEALSGHPLLRNSSVTAARKAKFRPTLLKGKAVKVRGIIVYRFGNKPKKDSYQIPIDKRNLLNNKAISLPIPLYPAAARAVCASGLVKVEVSINSRGEVTSAKAIGGHPLLRRSVVEAAKLAKFHANIKPKIGGILIYDFNSKILKNCSKK